MKKIIILILLLIAVYGITAFIELKFNPLHWDKGSRALYLFSTGLVSLVCVWLWELEKDMNHLP